MACSFFLLPRSLGETVEVSQVQVIAAGERLCVHAETEVFKVFSQDTFFSVFVEHNIETSSIRRAAGAGHRGRGLCGEHSSTAFCGADHHGFLPAQGLQRLWSRVGWTSCGFSWDRVLSICAAEKSSRDRVQQPFYEANHRNPCNWSCWKIAVRGWVEVFPASPGIGPTAFWRGDSVWKLCHGDVHRGVPQLRDFSNRR